MIVLMARGRIRPPRNERINDMALYLALLYQPADQYFMQPGDVPAPGEHSVSPEYREFMAEAGPAGVIKGGEALLPPELSTTITVAGGKGGDVVVTDGPYAEAKEVLGGYFLIEAADLDDAIKWAAKIPAAWDGGKVELRPVVELNKQN
jgi:hypothetical protein